LVEHLSKHSDTLDQTVVYPSTNYPGRTQEGLLGQLLRKKYEPQIETWVDEGRTIQAESTEGKEENIEELWNWASEWIGPRVAKYAIEEAGDSYTIEEREAGIENVKTGLRRKLEEDEESSDGEDEDEEMEDVTMDVMTVRRSSVGQVEFGIGEIKKSPDAKSRSLDDIVKVATTGIVPNQRI
jgi:mediator of RNA polymerase II transcription subunit 8, fungi type